MSKNIVEAYKEFNEQLIILVSGLSGSGKSELGKYICRDFKLHCIDMRKFYKKNADEKIKLPNGKYIINYDTDNVVNWDDLNTDINKYKKDGVVIFGNMFPTDKLQFKTDFHIHLKIAKQELKQRIHAYIEKHPEKKFDEETENLRFNMHTYPYYLETIKRMKITKFMDATGMDENKIYDEVYDDLIKNINDNVYSSKHIIGNRINASSIKSNDTSLISPGETAIDDDYLISYHHED
jgi:cytidylate kinase